MNLDASISDDGVIDNWTAKRVGANCLPSIVDAALPAFFPGMPEFLADAAVGLADWTHKTLLVDNASVEGFAGDYDFPNKEVRHVTRDHGIRTAFWRSVGHSFSAFAKESMVDELAHAAGMDPLDVRLRNVQNNSRLRTVLEKAGEVYRRGPSAPNRFVGLSAQGSFMSYVAEVAEVSVEKGKIKVHKVTCVVDCGQVVNPAIVRDQMSGAIIFGLTAALHGNITIENGEIKESNFHDYPILRMNESPEIDVIIIDSDEAPTGVGEPGLPPIAAAVANAVFAATGQRLRSMPFNLA
jgi:isoquinoline 1-oxidoreductase/isoquinoline 1-oxidoreductase beta subunit